MKKKESKLRIKKTKANKEKNYLKKKVEVIKKTEMNLIISLTTHSNTYMFVAMRTMSSTHVTMATIAKNMIFKKKIEEKKSI